MKLRIHLAAVLFVLFVGVPAHACICSFVHPSVGFEMADAIFTGKIIRSKKPEWTIGVTRVWKGDVEPEVILFDSHARSSCGVRGLKRGPEYLFLTDIDNSKGFTRYRIQVCNWNTRLRGAKLSIEGNPLSKVTFEAPCSKRIEEWVLEGRGEGWLPQTNSIKLGYVKSASDGCGCSFAYNLAEFWKDKHLFVSPMDEPTFINIDGKDVQLRLTAKSKERMDEKVGDRSWETYVAGDLKVRIDYLVTKVCDPDDENCEITHYRATMTVMRGKQRRVVNGVAICGC